MFPTFVIADFIRDPAFCGIDWHRLQAGTPDQIRGDDDWGDGIRSRAALRLPQQWPEFQPLFGSPSLVVNVALQVDEICRGTQDQAEKIVGAQGSCDFAEAGTMMSGRNGGRCLGPMAHCIDGGSIRRIAVTDVHPCLILDRPEGRWLDCRQPVLVVPIECRVGSIGIVPDHVDIAIGRRWRILVQMIPNRVSDKTRPDPAVGQIERRNRREQMPAPPVGAQDGNYLGLRSAHLQEIACLAASGYGAAGRIPPAGGR